MLAVFDTASGAVSAAMAIQQRLATQPQDVPEHRRMLFRIGIHLGDVLEKLDGTVYGDGVNIAARLQALAEPGGIATSHAVQETVSSRTSALFEAIGEHTVKNIARPVQAFRLLCAVCPPGANEGQGAPVEDTASRAASDGPTSAARQAIRFTSGADGVRLAYAVSGTGPPLVKTPTWITHLEYDWKSPVSRHWLAELNRQHRLIRYDARGGGLSDWDVEDVSFEKWVSDLEAVVNAAGLQRFALTGTSQGAAVAIAFAARHPERVSRLILWGSFCRGMLRRHGGPALVEKAQTMIKLAELGWGTEDPAFVQVFTSQFIPGGTAEQWRWFSEKMRISTSPQNAVRFMRVVYDIDVCDLARQVRCPALVIHSRRDARIPYDEGKLTAALIPGAEFLTLESPNHVVLENEPAWTQLVTELRRFLAPASGGQGSTGQPK